jgi:nitroreductase
MNHSDLTAIVECAKLAPSVHNTQPWSFTTTGDTIGIRADRGRALPVLDPDGRELAVSCGAAIEFGYVAVRGLGRECTVHLLPDPSDPDLFATLEIGEARPADDDERALVEAVPRRYTDRGDYDAAHVEPGLMTTLEHGVDQRGVWLRELDHHGDRVAVIEALTSAEAATAADPAYRKELADWLRVETGPDGIPLAALGEPATSDTVSDVPLRDFTGEDRHPHPGGEGPPPTVARDTLLMIGAENDDPLTWLKSGRALGWLLLRLTVAGLSSQPLGQALDVETSRARLASELGLIGHVQFLLRTGVGHGQPTTGRRDAAILAE